eukprot:6452110-Karenia_brevis.AAC.1
MQFESPFGGMKNQHAPNRPPTSGGGIRLQVFGLGGFFKALGRLLEVSWGPRGVQGSIFMDFGW